MGRWLHDPITEPELPEGSSIRTIASEHEAEAWDDLYREAFGVTGTILSHHLRVMQDPDYNQNLDLAAIAPNGELAALCYCSIPGVEAGRGKVRAGTTEPVAVRQKYQRLGLGRAIILTGLRLLRSNAKGLPSSRPK
jgi:predicted N-acetyltransferase YhbS